MAQHMQHSMALDLALEGMSTDSSCLHLFQHRKARQGYSRDLPKIFAERRSNLETSSQNLTFI